MNEHRFKLLAFDLDGTLVNSLGMIEEAINRVLTEADLPTIHGHALREPIGLPLEDCVRFWIEGVYPEGELVEQSLVHADFGGLSPTFSRDARSRRNGRTHVSRCDGDPE